MSKTFFPDAPLPRTRLPARRDEHARPVRPRAQLAAALLVGWLPLVVLAGAERLLTGRADPLLRDVSVHVRLVAAVPLFLVAELALAHMARLTLRRLGDEGFIADDERARFDRLVARSERGRRAPAVQVVLAALAVLVGVGTLVGWFAPTGALAGSAAMRLSPARVWFGAVAQPLFVFLLLRALWRWAVWCATLIGLARLRLRLVPGHPDRRGGIAFVTLPSLAFHGPFMFAVAAVLCAAWGGQIWGRGAALGDFRNLFVAVVAVGELLAFGPLLVFTPRLFLAGRSGLVDYGALATDYVRRFRGRWIGTAPRDDLLGTADLQALNDLGGAFRESVQRTSVMVFDARELVGLVVIMFLPVLPLLFAALPAQEVVQRVGKLLLGAR